MALCGVEAEVERRDRLCEARRMLRSQLLPTRLVARLAALLAALAAPLPSRAAPAAPTSSPAAPPTPSDPAARALELAARIPAARHANREARRAAAELRDPSLRSAVEAALAAPWLPLDAWALGHREEAERRLRAAGLLASSTPLALPAARGAFASAPGGPCPGGHHAYPGGLAVHSWANLLHARGLAAAYRDTYGVELDDGWLVAGALWHDALKAATLPWDAQGGCGAEPLLAGTPLHHVLGLAAAILRHLPTPLVWVIAAAHAPPTAERLGDLCGYLRAAGIVATGQADAVPCPSLAPGARRPPIEAYVNHLADADYTLTGAAWLWYASQTSPGWQRFEELTQDGSDVAAWSRAQAR